MKIVTWNVNGIRSILNGSPQSILDRLDADIICLQETKITRDILDISLAKVKDYDAYYSFSKKRAGYSGVVTFCRDKARPCKAEEGLTGWLSTKEASDIVGHHGDYGDMSQPDLHDLDSEGRVVVTEHEMDGDDSQLVVVNIYCPRADPNNQDRLQFKMKFHVLLERRISGLLAAGKYVIVAGDLNVCHREIDHCEPGSPQEFLLDPSRIWLEKWLAAVPPGSICPHAMQDTFRFLHPTTRNAFTCWRSSTMARTTNYGTRIDYILADSTLCRRYLKACQLRPDVHGSDHCPVEAVFDFKLLPSMIYPSLSSRNMPEFMGRQSGISAFLAAVTLSSSVGLGTSPSGPTVLHRAASPPHKRCRPMQRKQTSSKSRGTSCITSFFTLAQLRTTIRHEDFSRRQLSDSSKTSVLTSDLSSKSACFQAPGSLSGVEVTDAPEVINDSHLPSMVDKLQQGKSGWEKLLRGPDPPPFCTGHREMCVLRTVKKPGPNLGRKFYACSRPIGHSSNKEARCNFFLWFKQTTTETR